MESVWTDATGQTFFVEQGIWGEVFSVFFPYMMFQLQFCPVSGEQCFCIFLKLNLQDH